MIDFLISGYWAGRGRGERAALRRIFNAEPAHRTGAEKFICVKGRKKLSLKNRRVTGVKTEGRSIGAGCHFCRGLPLIAICSTDTAARAVEKYAKNIEPVPADIDFITN